MNTDQLQSIIEAAWDDRAALSPDTQGERREAVDAAIMGLDDGKFRVAEKVGRDWIVHQWLKKAVLLGFRLEANVIMPGGPASGAWFDKVPSKFSGWTETDFAKAGIRAVPPCAVRRGAYIASGAVLMPSYVNLGARVGEGTMIDTWASVGSCAQVGQNCHISAGAGIGGVLEPLQANPTIIEDGCFIGARSEVVEGVIVREGAVLAMGVFISKSTKIYNRQTGETSFGEVPAYSVVVPGALPAKDGSHSLACAVIVKTVDARTREKTGVNELLRD
ncbi:2,3,4,5-tetrahydropyridine-2,6-dicarboxylate N-succinyltransferase [Algimonas ampicilliniresistens]|uniref:2,3,4,5-tetrahydropyridine-2,6-dicarboxylate N-succinyltransferase n=1 Tax=Algimonas ampicilliniresistens TaxID=1298735 RepID=A0ABQ5VBJ8_9PROT|nr:2,3,4,5-tetrahydropyridine-2,6-dicarboxylate N-succinyltransferase [Algimonas ampicilliniresistens]GLQ24134.1 2,3,4,5-tetrahydropyridine-2,6-dicarboxylate N-succinyltransferase [Algimonas ampicilliniresistens]